MTSLSRRALLAASASLVGCGTKTAAGAIALWTSYGGNNRQVLLRLVDRFHREQSSVRIQPTYQGDYFEGLVKLRTGMYLGSVPAISHVVGEVIPYLQAADVLEPLDGMSPETLRDVDPRLAQQGTFIGGDRYPLVALPFNRSTPVAYYNKPLFRKLGLEPPRTWQEMREVAKAATIHQGTTTTRYGFECPVDWWFWIALVGQAGGQVIEPDGTLSLGGEAGVAALELWQQMMDVDRSMKRPTGRDYKAWAVTNADFLAGRAAMIWTSTAYLKYLEETANFEVGAAPLPKNVRHAVPTGGTFFVVPRGVTREQKDKALVFLDWMMQPTQANEWATSTGYMPVSLAGRAQLERDGFFRQHPNFKVTLDQLAHAQPWPWAPKLFRVQREAVQPRLEAIVLEQLDARASLDAVKRELARP